MSEDREEIRLNDKFQPLYTTKKRYILITGGRGSAKSFHVSMFLTHLSYEVGHRILFSRYTMTAAHLSIIPEFIEKIELLGADKHFLIKQRDIVNTRTMSDIMFRGIKASSGNQTANLKSIQGVTTFVVDEAEEMTDEDAFDKIDLSVRSKAAQNRVIMVLNPTTQEHWIWKRWFVGHTKYVKIDGEKVAICTHPEVEHIHVTYLDNIKNLSESFLKRIAWIKNNHKEKYRHIILGGWMKKAEGVIFENWEEGKFDESLPHIWGQDFGYSVDPDTLIKVAVDESRKRIYLKEYMYQNGQSTSRLIEHMKEIMWDKDDEGEWVVSDDLIVSDCSEDRLIDDIRDAGFNVVPAYKPAGSVRAGIKKLLNYTIIVDPDSENAKTELDNYAWHDKKSETPIDKYNHIIDPLRYAVDHLSQGEADFG